MSSRPLSTGSLRAFRTSSAKNPVVIVLTFLVCWSLLFSSLVLAKAPAVNVQRQSSGGIPQAGPPAASVPNLDEVKGRNQPAPSAPPHLPSTIRSRHKPLLPRNGRKVGDLLPPVQVGTEKGMPPQESAPNLLAWNLSYANLDRYPISQPYEKRRSISDSPFSLWPLANATVTGNVAFDFSAAPLPQAANARIAF